MALKGSLYYFFQTHLCRTCICGIHKSLSWRLIFILSIVVGGAVYPLLWGREIVVDVNAPWFIYPIAGLLVGFGTRMGSGCTSGHGICGVARFSTRSLVATMTFILSAMVTHGLYSAISG